MAREVALTEGFATQYQLPKIPDAKAAKDQSHKGSALTASE